MRCKATRSGNNSLTHAARAYRMKYIACETHIAPLKAANKNQEEYFINSMRSGYVAVIGKANAGKSTLINVMVGEKVSIVSPKPQTTRERILGVLTEEDYQIVFVVGCFKNLQENRKFYEENENCLTVFFSR